MELKNKMCCMLGGLGEKRFGGRYRQGNRVFSSNEISETFIFGFSTSFLSPINPFSIS